MIKKKRRESSKKPRKPINKAKQFCMNIISNKKIDKDVITKFVKKLYTNKRWDNPLKKDDFFIVFDTREKRVCIELYRKINANYITLEDIHNNIKPKHLKINDDISLSKPSADIVEHHLISSKKTTVPQGLKWVTLSHHGPYFTWIMEPYEPHGVPIIYDGKKYKLSPKAEQVANFWAKRITTDETATIAHTEDPLFRKNFWKDFKTYLSPSNKKIMKDFNKFDFEDIRKELKQIKENETEKDKKKKKKISEERKHDYGYAIVNGVKEKIGGFVPEPSGLFLGRGKNKLRGRVKRDITPNEVTINIGKDSSIPKAPKGMKWKKVVHDQKAQWISKWQDPLTKKPKYIYLSAESQFKSGSDASKFENARKLNKFLDKIRNEYKKDVDAKNKETRQLATIIWLVDQYGIRMGGEKGELEAKTYGASTLLVKHIKFLKDTKIKLDFLGKDSIRYNKKLTVNQKIYDNLQSFVKGKSDNTPLFDRASACEVNNYLKKFDKGLSGKVFRTRLGSSIMYDALSKIKIKKNATVTQKKASFVDANILVAKQLNHQKTTTKASIKNIEKLKAGLKELEKELKKKKKEKRQVASLQKRVDNKKESIKMKEKLTSINPGTSLTNYIDPRLVTSWAKANNVPIDKIYTQTLRNKFKWAIDDTDATWNYEDSELLPGFEKLQSGSGESCNLPNIQKLEESDSESDSLIHNRTNILITKYHKMLKNYGYVLVKLDNGKLAVQRSKPITLIMYTKNTYNDIYNMLLELKKNDLGLLGMLLLGQICRDALKNKKIKKILKEYGYNKKYLTSIL